MLLPLCLSEDWTEAPFKTPVWVTRAPSPGTLVKLPLSQEFMDSGSYASLLVRCARYAVIAFAEFSLYPMLFKLTARIGRGEQK